MCGTVMRGAVALPGSKATSRANGSRRKLGDPTSDRQPLRLPARAQQGERMRRIGVLMPEDENDPLAKTYVSAFTQALAGLGWTDGRNVRMAFRWAGGDINRTRALAHELVGLQPDIIVTDGSPA